MYRPCSARTATLAIARPVRVIAQIHAQGLSGDGETAGVARPEGAGGDQHLLLASGTLAYFHLTFLSCCIHPVRSVELVATWPATLMAFGGCLRKWARRPLNGGQVVRQSSDISRESYEFVALEVQRDGSIRQMEPATAADIEHGVPVLIHL